MTSVPFERGGAHDARRSRRAVRHVWRLVRALLVVAAIGLLQCSSTPDGPVVVGVLLPLSGPTSFGYQRALELARANIEAGGGIHGRALELRLVDIAKEDAATAAKAMADDRAVVAAIGPDTSTVAFAAAPLFDAAKKPLLISSNYDIDLRQWVAHQFAFALWDASAHAPDVDLRRTFGALYARVPGSHVKLYNTQNFGITGSIALGDFFRP